MEKWPTWEERVVKIQLDNAPVHPRPGRLGKRLNQHLAQLQDVAGWDIDFIAQPAKLARHKYTGSCLFLRNSIVAVSETGKEPQQADCQC